MLGNDTETSFLADNFSIAPKLPVADARRFWVLPGALLSRPADERRLWRPRSNRPPRTLVFTGFRESRNVFRRLSPRRRRTALMSDWRSCSSSSITCSTAATKLPKRS